MAQRDGHLSGGELNSAISSALVGVHREHFRRGPTRASTFHHDSVLVTIMYEVQTPATRRLVQMGHADEVQRLRQLFIEGLEDDCKSVVQRLTGREVLAFIAGSSPEPDISTWVFVLDGAVARGPSDAPQPPGG